MMSLFVFSLLIVLAALVGRASAFLLPFTRTLTNVHRWPVRPTPTLSKLKHKPRLSTIRLYKPLDPGISHDVMKNSFPAEVEAQPSKRVIQLEYNYLSPSSIFTIRHKWKPGHTTSTEATARGVVKEDRPGDSFLINWWHMAKKWGVLRGHLLRLRVTERDRLACAANIARPSSIVGTCVGAGDRSAHADGDGSCLVSSSAVQSMYNDTTTTFDQDLLFLKGVLERPNVGDALERNTERRMNESMARLLHKHQDALKARIGDKIYEKYEKMYGMYDRDALRSNNNATSVHNVDSSEHESQSWDLQEDRIADFLGALSASGHETAMTKSDLLSGILALALADPHKKCTSKDGANEEVEGGASKVEEEAVPLEALHELCRNHTARLIAIGDVHGCAAEVRNLLRKVVFMPGDQILFLGDLVIKGPDSSKVVRMAMDLGALAVRGNHDHEAIRDYFTTVLPLKRAYLRYQEVRRKLQLDQGTHRTENRSSDAVDEDNPEKKKNDTPQAPQDPTATRSEASGPESSYIDRIAASLAPRLSTRPHAFLAAALTPKEMAWMCEMPYIIQSGDLRAVFVHAELQRDVPLDDQQPHVNMYMTINKKWAKFWPGPLTAYFGHDTARGLQKHQFSYGLDTGCVYGGPLTAVLLPHKEIVEVTSSKRKMKD